MSGSRSKGALSREEALRFQGEHLNRILDGMGGFRFVFTRFYEHYEVRLHDFVPAG